MVVKSNLQKDGILEETLLALSRGQNPHNFDVGKSLAASHTHLPTSMSTQHADSRPQGCLGTRQRPAKNGRAANEMLLWE